MVAVKARWCKRRADFVASEWHPLLNTALLWAVRGGGSDIYDVEGGMTRPITKARARGDMPVYTFEFKVYTGQAAAKHEPSVGSAVCVRFKRWMTTAKFQKLRTLTG